MKRKKASILILALIMMLSLALTACAGGGTPSGGSQPDDGDDGPAIGPGDVAGFEEFPIGDDIELGPLNVAGVYFQPVDMEPAGSSLPASEADMHLEADISALQNDLGYGVGDFVPYLTVKYELEKEDGTIIEGNFMPMSASDGPHYGANVKFGEAGTYKVRFIIENPEAQGYLLHVDEETGVPGSFWSEPLVAEWEFDYVPSSINAEAGQKLKFFGQTFSVAARLHKTGMGFDTSVFMNLSTAKQAARDSERLRAHPAAEDEALISCVAVKIKDGYDAKDVANGILQAHAREGVHVVVAKNMISSVSGSLRGLTAYICILAAVLWTLAMGVLTIVFFNSRKREFGVYRVLGASRGRLIRLILWESSLVSLLGAAAGIAAAALVIFPFNAYIGGLLELPYLRPPARSVLAVAAVSLALSFGTGPVASAYSAFKIGRLEIYTAMRENE